jgi:hypothetical protein
VMALTIIIGSFGFLQSVLSWVARRTPEAGAFHAGVAYMQQVVESRWDPLISALSFLALWWEFSLVMSELFIYNHELGTSVPNALDEYSVWMALPATSLSMIFGPYNSLCFFALDLYCDA